MNQKDKSITMKEAKGGGVRKGAWTEEEDFLLKKCIQTYGEGKWFQMPTRAGLNRCRKSCRLRWLNYLRPNIKRGELQEDEVDLILRLHKLLGNRWSLIAGRLPGRTANDVKNYWNTHLAKRFRSSGAAKLPKKHDHLVKVHAIRPRPRTFKNLFSQRATNSLFNIDQGISWPPSPPPPPPPLSIGTIADGIATIPPPSTDILLELEANSKLPPPLDQRNDVSWWESLLDDIYCVSEGGGGDHSPAATNHMQGGSLWSGDDELDGSNENELYFDDTQLWDLLIADNNGGAVK